MAWRGRILVGLCGLLLSGCTTPGSAGVGATGPGRLAANVEPQGAIQQVAHAEPDSAPRLARSQLPDPTTLPPARPSAVDKAAGVLPPLGLDVKSAANPLLPVSGALGAERAAALLEKSEVRIKVRAWVNGQPIFEDELLQIVGPSLRDLGKLQEPERTETLHKMIKNAADHLVDQEVMYQDAVRKLEKGNPQALKKLKELVRHDYDKSVSKMRAAGVPDEQIKMFEHVTRRMLERSMISTEYARNHIMGHVQEQVTLDAIGAYYEAHKNEFQTVDKVQWQDVFIAVGPKHPTSADAKRYAEELIAKCRAPEDFAKLLPFDDGDSKFRGGAGFGQRRGEIRPPELEPYLFALKDGQIGPVVELPTGVHIFSLTKRDYAGQLPLSEQTQKAIRRKMEGQIAEREYKHLVRELRARSVIRVVLDTP